jgi:hypothetical protein
VICCCVLMRFTKWSDLCFLSSESVDLKYKLVCVRTSTN